MFRQAVSSLARTAQSPVMARGLADKAGKVKLPVQLYGLPARYANALYMAAAKQNALDTVEKDLQALKTLIKEVPTFKPYLVNPIISRKNKLEDVQLFSKGMSQLTQGFLSVLAENGRLGELEKITTTFDKLLNAKRGLVEARVVSAGPLSAAQEKQLDAALQSMAKEGEKLKVERVVDASIIGGLQVQVADRFIDLSINSRINKMHKALGA